jgi:hypothetical protein
MNRFILMILLSIVNNSSMAELIQLGSKGDQTIYVDSLSFINNNYMVKTWVLFDNQNPGNINNKKYLSFKAQYECNCKKNLIRLLKSKFYSSNMGNGKIIAVDTEPGEWIVVPPISYSGTASSGNQMIRTVSCGKKWPNTIQ